MLFRRQHKITKIFVERASRSFVYRFVYRVVPFLKLSCCAACPTTQQISVQGNPPKTLVGMGRLLLLIGLPGSGKSTLARQWQQQGGRLLVSTDAIRQKLFGDEAIQGPWGLVQCELRQQLRSGLEQIAQGQVQEVIYDATNTRRRYRREIIRLCRALGFGTIIAVWLDTPLSLCLERNLQRDRQVPESVIYRMARQLENAPPSLNEDLDCLIRYSASG
jgi:predicted kinase